MVLLVLLAIAVGAVLGAGAALAAWPVLAVGAAVVYCLGRPARRVVRSVVAALTVLVAVGYVLGPWTLSPGSTAAVWWFVVPLAVAALIVLAGGGPRRIKARRARAEAHRRRLRAEAAAQARVAREAEADARRQARHEVVKQRTGLDVDLLAEAAAERAGRWVRAAGGLITRRLERNRPRRPADDGPPQWLDLDRDVAADLSRRQSEEILRLAGELDRSRPQPR